MGTRIERILALAGLAEDAYADYCAAAPPPLPVSARRRSVPTPPGPHAGWYRLIHDLYLVAADPLVADFDAPSARYSASTQLVVDLLVSRSRLPADDQWLLTTARARYAEPATNFISSQLHPEGSEPRTGTDAPQASGIQSLSPPRPRPRMPLTSPPPTDRPPLLFPSLDPRLRVSPSPTSTVRAGAGNSIVLPDVGAAAALQDSAPNWFERYLNRAETLIRVQRAIERIQESLQPEPADGPSGATDAADSRRLSQLEPTPAPARLQTLWSSRSGEVESPDRVRRSMMDRYSEITEFLEQAITMQRARERARAANPRASPVDTTASVPPWRSPPPATSLRSTTTTAADQSAITPTRLAAVQALRRMSPPPPTGRVPFLSTPALWSPIDEGWSPIPPPASDSLVTPTNRRSFPPPIPQRRSELLVPYEPLGQRRLRRFGGDLTEATPPLRARTRSQSPRIDWSSNSPVEQSGPATVRLRNRLQVLPYRHPHRSAHVFADGDDPDSPWTLMENAQRTSPHPLDGTTDPDGENVHLSPGGTAILSDSPVASPGGSPEQRPAAPASLHPYLSVTGRERWQLQDVSPSTRSSTNLPAVPSTREEEADDSRYPETEPLLAPARGESDLRATRAPRRLPSITDEDVQELRPLTRERPFSRAPGGYAPGAPALQNRRAQNTAFSADDRTGTSDTRTRLRSATEAAASWHETRVLLQELRSRLEELEPAVANARASIADARATVQAVAARSAARQDQNRREGTGRADPSTRNAPPSPLQSRDPALEERDKARLFLLSHRRGYPGDPPSAPLTPSETGPSVQLTPPSDVPNRHPHPPSPTGTPPPVLLPAVQLDLPEAPLPAWLNKVRARVAIGPGEGHIRPLERAQFHGWIVSQATLSRAMDLLDRGHGTLPQALVPWAVFIDLLALHIVLAAPLPAAAVEYSAEPLEKATVQGLRERPVCPHPTRLDVHPLDRLTSVTPKLAVGTFCIPGAPLDGSAQLAGPPPKTPLLGKAKDELLQTVVHDLRDVAGRVWDATFELSACADLLDGGVSWVLDPQTTVELSEKMRENDHASPLTDWQALHLLSTAHTDVRGGIRPSHIYYVPHGVVVSRVLALLKHMQRRMTPPSPIPTSTAPLVDLTELRLTRSLGAAGGGMLEMRDKKQLDSVVDCALSSGPGSPSDDLDAPRVGWARTGRARQALPPRLFSAMDDRNFIPPRPRPSLTQALPKVTVAVFRMPRVNVTEEYLAKVGDWMSGYASDSFRGLAGPDGVRPWALLVFAPGHAVAQAVQWFDRAKPLALRAREEPTYSERKKALSARMAARAAARAEGTGRGTPHVVSGAGAAAWCATPTGVDAATVLTLAVAGPNATEVLESLSVQAVGTTGRLARFDVPTQGRAPYTSLFAL